MDAVWDGITRPEDLSHEGQALRNRLADHARSYDWPEVLAILAREPTLINSSRPGGASRFAPLHQAAHGGAPAEVVDKLIEMGAWRLLRNAAGERPFEVAQRKDHFHLSRSLEPVPRRDVPPATLGALERYFHAVIRGRAGNLVEQHALRLPELEPLLEMERPVVWFAVPGMYGGFRYRLEDEGAGAKLVTESWCRVVDGSGQRHEILASGSRLIEEGFV
jgi:hypothetical protein